ncbi:MAG: insulinase family protein [Armatimonadetes bacterium]|nr:insulinase family protein [Armatimonadota bacterium]
MAAVFAVGQVSSAPRLTETFPSGIRAGVQSMPEAQTVSVGLFLSLKDVPESVRRAGWPHFLEHLIASHADPALDERLESKGMSLTASTTATSIRFEVKGSGSDFKLAVEAIQTLLKPFAITEEMVSKEKLTLRQEWFQVKFDRQPAIDAWNAACSFPHPFGQPAWLDMATAQNLSDLWSHLITGTHVAICAAGPGTSADMLEALRPLDAAVSESVAAPPAGPELPPAERGPSGPFWAWSVPSLDSPTAARALACALGLKSVEPDVQISFTPSSQVSALSVTLPSYQQWSRVTKDLETSAETTADTGLRLARAWVRRVISSPSGLVMVWGPLLAEGSDIKPDALVAQVDAISAGSVESELRKALDVGVGKVVR